MRNLLPITLLLLLFVQAKGQNIHIFGGAGLMNYQGDLQPRRLTLGQSHAYFGGGLYYEVLPSLYLKLGFLNGKVSADDKLQPRNKSRNLNFTSKILEAQLSAEYDLINPYEHWVIPYISVGVAVFRFDPYTFVGTQKVFLQPLGTEGQGAAGKPKYNLTQMAIPFGGGLKFALNDDVFVRADASLRRLSTDYLDDVSTFYAPQAQLIALNGPLAAQVAFRGDELTPPLVYPTSATAIRGNPKSKDYYYTFGLSISYRLGNGDGGSGKGGKSKLGCPVNVY